MKLNATATRVNTYRQPGSHVQKGGSFRFEAERKELTRLTEENGPTTQRMHQSVADAHSGLRMGGDTVIQVMGGRCLEALNNCAIHAIEGLVFARETYTSENGETIHVP